MEDFSLEKLSMLLGKDRRTLAKILDAVKPDRVEGKKKRWTLKTVVNTLVAHELRTNNRTNKAVDEHILLARERRKKLQLANEEQAGKVVRLDVLIKVLSARYRNIKELFLALPGTEADYCSFGDSEKRIAIEGRLRDRVYEILTELSNPKSVADEAIGDNKREVAEDEQQDEAA